MICALNVFNLIPGREDEYRDYPVKAGRIIYGLGGKVVSAGAGLDAFVAEPKVPEALFKLDNVVLQPHVSSGTVQTRAAMSRLVVDNLAAFFAGKPLVTQV